MIISYECFFFFVIISYEINLNIYYVNEVLVLMVWKIEILDIFDLGGCIFEFCYLEVDFLLDLD